LVFELGRLDYFDYAVEFLFGVSFVLLLAHLDEDQIGCGDQPDDEEDQCEDIILGLH
jgi:hypothetical protein